MCCLKLKQPISNKPVDARAHYCYCSCSVSAHAKGIKLYDYASMMHNGHRAILYMSAMCLLEGTHSNLIES